MIVMPARSKAWATPPAAKLSGNISDSRIYSVLSDALAPTDLLAMEMSASNYRSLAWMKAQLDGSASTAAQNVSSYPKDCEVGFDTRTEGVRPVLHITNFYWAHVNGQLPGPFDCQFIAPAPSRKPVCPGHTEQTNWDAMKSVVNDVCSYLKDQSSAYQTFTSASSNTESLIQKASAGYNALVDVANKLKPKGSEDLPKIQAGS
jgi:hypothetical protein